MCLQYITFFKSRVFFPWNIRNLDSATFYIVISANIQVTCTYALLIYFYDQRIFPPFPGASRCCISPFASDIQENCFKCNAGRFSQRTRNLPHWQLRQQRDHSYFIKILVEVVLVCAPVEVSSCLNVTQTDPCMRQRLWHWPLCLSPGLLGCVLSMNSVLTYSLVAGTRGMHNTAQILIFFSEK